jgi:hypothetical protein
LRACAGCLEALASLLRALDEDNLAPLARSLRHHRNDTDAATDAATASTAPATVRGGGGDAVSSKRLSKDKSKEEASKVDALIVAASGKVAVARRLAAAAACEPELWHAPFPGAYVARVLDGERSCLERFWDRSSTVRTLK